MTGPNSARIVGGGGSYSNARPGPIMTHPRTAKPIRLTAPIFNISAIEHIERSRCKHEFTQVIVTADSYGFPGPRFASAEIQA